MNRLTYWIAYIDTDDTAVASIYNGNGSAIFKDMSYTKAVPLVIFSQTYDETKGDWGWKPVNLCMARIRERLANAPIVLFDARTEEVYLGFASNKNLVCMPYDWKTMTGFMDRLDFSSGVIMIQAIKNIMDSAKYHGFS